MHIYIYFSYAYIYHIYNYSCGLSTATVEDCVSVCVSVCVSITQKTRIVFKKDKATQHAILKKEDAVNDFN